MDLTTYLNPLRTTSPVMAALVDAATRGDRHVVDLPQTVGNSARLLVDTAQFVPAVLRDIAAARHQVNITMFSWQDDGTGKRLAEALKYKARQGIEVNVQIDAIGSQQWPLSRRRAFINDMKAAGVSVKRHWPTSASGTIDHRKIFEIDGRIAYLGGMNLAAKYDNWHDVMVRLEGPAAAQAGAELAGRWIDTGGKISPRRVAVLTAHGPRKPTLNARAAVKLLGNSPQIELAATREFFHLAATAKKRLWVMSPYIGNKEMVNALTRAAKRGVDVRVTVPGPNEWKNGQFTAKLTRGFYSDLLRAGVKLYEQPQMTHAKLWLSDNTANISSVNLDRRSAMDAYEIGATIADTSFRRQVEQLFLRDFKRSRQIGAKDSDQYRAVELLRKKLNLRV